MNHGGPREWGPRACVPRSPTAHRGLCSLFVGLRAPGGGHHLRAGHTWSPGPGGTWSPLLGRCSSSQVPGALEDDAGGQGNGGRSRPSLLPQVGRGRDSWTECEPQTGSSHPGPARHGVGHWAGGTGRTAGADWSPWTLGRSPQGAGTAGSHVDEPHCVPTRPGLWGSGGPWEVLPSLMVW